MKKKLIYLVVLLLNVCLFTFSSCSNDDDDNNSNALNVDLEEVGLENCKEVMAGTDLHIEAEILAMNLTKSIDVKINSADGTNVFTKSYTTGNYINIKNTEFHEHLDIPEDIAAGNYTLRFIVTDKLDNVVTKESALTITEYDAKHPTVDMVNVGNNNDKTGIIGSSINVAATINAQNKIADIEIEFHNTDTGKETELDLEDLNLSDKYKGLTIADFNENIAIPAECTAGTYHIHFTVTDEKGESYTAENEGVQIKNK